MDVLRVTTCTFNFTLYALDSGHQINVSSYYIESDRIICRSDNLNLKVGEGVGDIIYM